MNPPCKGCKDRQLGCHGTCEKYGEYKKAQEKLYVERRHNRAIRDFISDSYKRQDAHIIKNKKWKGNEQ